MTLMHRIKAVLHVLVLLTVVGTALWIVSTLRHSPSLPVTVMHALDNASSSSFSSSSSSSSSLVSGSPVVDVSGNQVSHVVSNPQEMKLKVEDQKMMAHRTPDTPQVGSPVVQSTVNSVPSSVRGQQDNMSEGDHQEPALQTPDNPQDGWGQFPDWWLRAWPQSAVSGSQHVFVGDKPLFPPCTTSPGPSNFPFVKPRNYINNSKNPCWYERPKSLKDLRCVAYVYLAGVSKCGTTDLARRLKVHPQVFPGTSKEYHWWERYRFGHIHPDYTYGTKSFREYLRDLTGDGLGDIERELQLNGSSRRIFGDYSPSYFWDPRHWQDMDGNEGCQEPRVIVAQHIYHMYPQAKLLFTFRHPTPRLYSRFLSRIHRVQYLKKTSVEEFHRYVVHGVKVYMDCFREWSVRHCAYNMSRYDRSVVRLVEGMYPVFMTDWLRVWPREQMFIMRYEDYGGHENEKLAEIFEFLGLDPMEQSQMDKVMEMDVANSGSKEYTQYGSMLPETKQLLDTFYQPFVLQFARILNDPRFLWKDVYQ